MDFIEKDERPSFKINCSGIPIDYAAEFVEGDADADPEEIRELLDPVTWAAKYLDFHCLDPDGEIWKRKDPKEYHEWVKNHPGESVLGKSRYHRPYQSAMLRCQSKRKVFRAGRQLGKSVAIGILILYYMAVKPGKSEKDGFKIILLAPYQSQIDVVFKIVLDFIEGSDILKNSIASSTRSPPRKLELNNGSTLIGFTAGTKSGSGAASARGQAADFLCFDETDYLAAADVDAAMSIITNYPEALVLMSSTPTGKREKFYELAHSANWKEFHYPSYENPLWNKEFEKTMRETLSSQAWVFEIEAGWGEKTQGIFQNQYVDAAKMPYKYGDLVRDREWIYTLGVDWNDPANGTMICVIGFNPSNRKYYLVDRAAVHRVEWTQLVACQKIAEMNRLWRPQAIYVDRGYGSTQLELLHLMGVQAIKDEKRGRAHPDAMLKKTVGFDSGSKIETTDPWTGEVTKKEAKPFMVENATRFVENQIFHFSASDKDLASQFNGYEIERVSDLGRPKYRAGPKGDHILDAVMLALVAFALEVSGMGKPVFSSTVVFSEGTVLPSPDREEGEKEIIRLTDNSFLVQEVKRSDPFAGRSEGRVDAMDSPLVSVGAAPTDFRGGPSRQNASQRKSSLHTGGQGGIFRGRGGSRRTRGF